jgi:hypothetical protein
MDDYADLLEKAQSAPAIDAATSPAVSLSIAADAIPAQEAEYQRLARKYNVPVDIPRAMPEEYRSKAKLDDALSASSGNPALQNWLANPDKARIAQNDVGTLGTIGRLFGSFKGGFMTAHLQAEDTDLNMAELNNRQMSDAEIRRMSQITQEIGDLAKLKDNESATDYGARTAGYSARQFGSNLYAGAQGAGYGGVAGAALGAIPTVGVGAPFGAGIGMIVGGAMSAGLYSYRMEASGAWKELKERKDVSGAPLDKDVARAAAHATGVINGAIEIGSDIAIGWLVSKIPGVKEMIGNAVGTTAVKAAIREAAISNPGKMATVWAALKTALGISATEGSEEFVQQLAGGAVQRIAEGASGQTFTPKPWSEDVKEGVSAAGEAFTGTLLTLGLFAGSGHYISTRRQVKESERISQALEHYTKLEEIFKRSNDSEVRTLDADTFAEISQQMADGTEGAPKSVFIDARTLATTLQENPEAAAVFNQMSPEVQQQITDAVPGASIELPIGELLSKATGTPLEAALLPHLRTQEDGLSQTEAKEADAELVKMVDQETERIISESQKGEKIRTEANQIHDYYSQQLQATGVYTKSQSDEMALLTKASFVALSTRSGMTPLEFQRKYPLQIVAGGAIGEAFTQDRPGNPNFDKWFSDSKVVDEQGNPLVVYHGTAQEMVGGAFNADMAKSEGGAFYFSHSSLMKNPATNANDYARNRSGDAPNVIPVYLRMENPLVTGFTEPMPEGDSAISAWLDRMQKFNRSIDMSKDQYYKRAIDDSPMRPMSTSPLAPSRSRASSIAAHSTRTTRTSCTN